MGDLNNVTIQSSQSVNELICLDEYTSSISQTDFGGITLDNFTLDDLNDDEFNPRAVDSLKQQQQQLPSTLVQVLTANEPTTTPTGLLVPPPTTTTTTTTTTPATTTTTTTTTPM